MTIDCNPKVKRKATRSAYHNWKPMFDGSFKWRFRRGRRLRKLLPHLDKNKKVPLRVFIGRGMPLFNLRNRIAAQKQKAWEENRPEDCKQGNHEFVNEACIHCGTSIWRWAFCEMP